MRWAVCGLVLMAALPVALQEVQPWTKNTSTACRAYFDASYLSQASRPAEAGMAAYDCDCVMNALATDLQVADATRSCSKAVNAKV